MIAMSRCGAICLMVGGPTPLGRGRTDAPEKRIEYIASIWSKDEDNTCDGRRVRVEFTRDSRWADSGSRYGRGKVVSRSFFLRSFYLTKKNK